MRPNSGRNFSSEGPTSDTVAPIRRQCRECDVRTATRWYSWCRVLFESFSVSVCMLFESRASEAKTCELLVCIGHRRSWTPRAFPSVLWAPCCSVHTMVTLLGAHESVVSCVPVFCVLPAFRACVSSLVTVCCSNLQFILAVPEDGTQMCKS